MRNNIANGYEAISVSVNPFNTNISRDFWNAYRMTWGHLQDIPYYKDNITIRKACMDVVLNKALPTPKESVKFNFEIKNISRVCLAQITRGRIGWWFNVESQMPQYVNHGVTVPKNLAESDYAETIDNLVQYSQDVYDTLVKEGYPPQDLRYLLLHGQQTSMVADVNFAALPGFFAMRTENGLTDELNLVARMMRREIKNYVDQNCDNDLDKELWDAMINQLDCLGAKQQKCLIYDRVFGNTGRFPSGNDEVCEQEDADFDFKKSAWYLELKELPDDLLLPGEKEMIEGWNDE